MVSSSEWFTEGTKGKSKINSITIYKSLSSEIVRQIEQDLSVSEIINWIKSKTTEAFISKYAKSPEIGAINNALGRWNEFIATSLLSEIVIDVNQKYNICATVFSLPNSQVQKQGVDEASSKFLTLFHSKEFASGEVMSQITPFKSNIFLPSPDYIIAVIKSKNTDISPSFVQLLLEKQAKEPDSLALYNLMKGKLYIEEVRAVASLKTSNRPDRRYQPLFEAAMIKSMDHILKQNWRYYMVASDLSNADRTIFNTAIAPHGVALQQNFKLVDGTYLYNRKEDLMPLIEAAIRQ